MAAPGAVRLRGSLADWTQFGMKSWGRGTLTVDDGAAVTVIGVIAGGRAGCYVTCDGRYEVHPKYGEQFVVVRAEVSAPNTAAAAIAWIAATFPHVGRRRAQAMVDQFGGVEALWQVLVTAPDRLTAISGVTLARAEEIRAAYLDALGDRDSQITLRGWGLTASQIGRCVAHWRTAAAAVQAIRADPYELYRQVDGFGWTRADGVARATGIPLDAPTRIAAAIDHVLRRSHGDGHVYMRPGFFSREARELLGDGVPAAAVRAGISRALRAGYVVKRGARVYLSHVDKAEQQLAELIGDKQHAALG